MRYLVGSGHFSRSYIVEVDGFLHESPITWYAGKQKWGMSPGYDGARHAGFDRPIIETCLYCHAGRVEPVDGAAHRLTLHEKAIGCESCHGPGSFHREFHLAKKSLVGDVDLTIVNPRKLSRSLQDDTSPIKLRIANRLFGEKSYTFESTFLRTTRGQFRQFLLPRRDCISEVKHQGAIWKYRNGFVYSVMQPARQQQDAVALVVPTRFARQVVNRARANARLE